MDSSKTPLVSICLPVYNGADYLARALESCIHQTYSNFEVIVVDNCSTDGTEALVRSYMAKDARIRFERNSKPLPVMRNFYRSFELARGEFVQHLGHDDWFARNYVEEVVRCVTEDPSSGGVMTRLVSFMVAPDGSSTMNNDVSVRPGRYPTRYLVRNVFQVPIGGLSFLALMRRTDVLAALPILETTFRNPAYGKEYENAQGTDWVVFLSVLTRYDHFTFTDRTAFLKTGHARAFGFSSAGHSLVSIPAIFRYRDFSRNCLTPLYAASYPDAVRPLKVRLAAHALADIALGWLRVTDKRAFVGEPGQGALARFLAGYTRGERFSAFLAAIPLSLRRAASFIVRRRTLPQRLENPERYFLNEKLEFTLS